jgi:hypothetical protein
VRINEREKEGIVLDTVEKELRVALNNNRAQVLKNRRDKNKLNKLNKLNF